MPIYWLWSGTLLILASLAIFIWPHEFWPFGRGLRFANPDAIELSTGGVPWLRMCAAVGIVMGIVLLVGAFE